MTSPFRSAFVVLLLAVMSSGCGYALAGRGSSLPEYIRVIGVPLFKNATAIFDVDRLITERVRTELIGRGSYRVVPDATGVDALVEATITSVSVTPSSFDQNNQASRYNITITASVTFRDVKANKEIWSNPSVTFTDEYQLSNASSAAEAVTFFGQDTAAQTRLAGNFARAVVSAMLEAF
ncbi:MAG: LptE family protein [Acidobacteria bacterium]|nr:LptE family protein [Acidobacteriota bacterium]